jgi:hypothetical protein
MPRNNLKTILKVYRSMKIPILFPECGCFPINITVYSNQNFKEGKAFKLTD